jgi:hypothetical protein
MKKFSPFSFLLLILIPLFATISQDKKPLPRTAYGQYDESKVPQYTLPDPLVLSNGNRVTDTSTWNSVRRQEILGMFEMNVYGKAAIERPDDMHWETTAVDSNALNDFAISKKLTIYFSKKNARPRLNVTVLLPKIGKPVPVFLVSTWGPDAKLLIRNGFGLVTYDARQIEPDNKDSAYAYGIRKFFDPPDRTEPAADEWGTIAAWSWTASRVMDYVETDPALDSRRVCILGFSRFGKAAMWAGALDQRFAIVLSCESGCGGATFVRRGYGETVKLINDQFPHWFNGNFKTYNDRVNDLPVDWHMLIALMAPRPVYVSTAELDRWGDPHGTFLAGQAAEPVYELFGETGLDVKEMPPLETPVGDFIGYHMRKGKHGITAYDTEKFLDFARRHFSAMDAQNSH